MAQAAITNMITPLRAKHAVVRAALRSRIASGLSYPRRRVSSSNKRWIPAFAGMTGYAYDPAHRLSSVTDSRGGKKLSYDYSPGGLLNTLADNEGHRTDYLYDAVGRLAGIWAPNDDNTPLQRLVSAEANLRSKLSAQRGHSHYDTYVYDAGGRLTDNTPRQRLVAVKANICRRPMLCRSQKWFPNGVSAEYTWNPDNTLAQVRNRNNYSDAFVLSQHDYTYNGAGQRKTAQDKLGIYAPPAMNEAYAYDPLGNRTARNDGNGQLYYVYDAANQLKEIRQTNQSGALLTAMIYDANGNLTQKCEGGAITQTQTSCTGASIATFTYDALNQLIKVDRDGQVSQYAYDDAGRRIRKTVNGATTNYLYNGPDIQAEYQNWSRANISYTHGPNTDDPLIRVNAANDASYFHQDGLGSVVATTDQTGNLTAAQLYDAWGKPQQGASQGNLGQYGYTGREPDETGMMYYRARYYDPSVGRFTQRDPAGMPDGVNRYAYVGSNPINATDPSGLALETPWDAFNVGLGMVSLANNVRQGNWGWAAVDVAGLAYDSVATAVPFLPAGASASLQAYRAGNSAVNSMQVGLDVAKVGKIANEAARAANTAGNAAQAGKAIHTQVSTAIKSGDVSLSKSATQNFWGANGATGKMPDLSWKNSPGVWADLTTSGQWGKHVSTYGDDFGAGIPLLYQRGTGLVDTVQLRTFMGSALTGGQMLFDSGSYFSNLSSSGGAGAQTMSGVSPRP